MVVDLTGSAMIRRYPRAAWQFWQGDMGGRVKGMMRLARIASHLSLSLLSLWILATLVSPGCLAAQEAGLMLASGGAHEKVRILSLRDLAALPQVTIITKNDFTDGDVAYTGPLARDVLKLMGIDFVKLVRLTAINGYYVDIPVSDFLDYNVILAMQANGVPLSRREKGPLWLMYPISSSPELRDPIYVHRLIWQVVRIEGL